MTVAAAVVAAIAAIMLLRPAAVAPDWAGPPPSPPLALGLALCALGMALAQSRSGAVARAGRTCAALAAAVAAGEASAFIASGSFGLVSAPSAAVAGATSIDVSASLIVVAGATAVVGGRVLTAARIWLVPLAAAVPTAVLFDHVSGGGVVGRLGMGAVLTPLAAGCLLVLAIAALVAHPHGGALAALRRRSPGGALLRRLAPVVVLVPLAIGTIHVLADRSGLHATELGVVALVALPIALMLFVLRRAAAQIDLLDAARSASHEASQRERERLNALVDRAPVGIFEADRRGRCTMVNPAYEELTGLGGATALGEGWVRAIHPGDLDRVLGEWRAAHLHGADVHSQFRLCPVGQPIRWVEARGVRLSSASGDGWIATVVDVTDRVQLERDHEVRRSIAAAVADGLDTAGVLALACRQITAACGSDGATVVRYEGEAGLVAGAFAVPGAPAVELGMPVPLIPGSTLEAVHRTQAPARMDYRRLVDIQRRVLKGPPTYRSGVGAPIRFEGRLWGMLTIATRSEIPFGADAEERLTRFADLIATAIEATSAREDLHRQAQTDELTGLPNVRAFRRRLAEEIDAAASTGEPVSLVVLDIDHFKRVNDTFGHQVGDAVLVEVTRRLGAAVRAGEMLARVGGEEFAWIQPATAGLDAFRAAERVRRAVAGLPIADAGTVTLSAGVSELTPGASAADVFRQADLALYRAKRHGRNMTFRHSDEVVDALLQPAQRRRAARAKATAALGLLAEAVDARQPRTQGHARRVADIAEALAREAGWNPERAMLLREAALLHDLGRVGEGPGGAVPGDAAAAGARLAGEVLDAEPAGWIRDRVERIDGAGPAGLSDSAVSEGARLLAVADAWDELVSCRDPGLDPRAALAEIGTGVGTRFCAATATHLSRLLAAGDARLAPAAAPDDFTPVAEPGGRAMAGAGR